MVDIIEFALEHYTDFRQFEKLSIEILKLNGFDSIIPIGGIDDEGIDALVVKYYQDETYTTIFQITLQDNINSKIYSTIDKLIENKVKFNELILVTSNQINNTQAIKTNVRKKYTGTIKLEIYERTMFISTLSVEKNIFTRYFGDLKQQLNSSLFDKSTLFTEDSTETLTNSLLKCSLLFTFNQDGTKTRKALFDRTVLSILVDLKIGTSEKIASVFSDKFHKIVSVDQINSSLTKLKTNGLVIKNGDNEFTPSKDSIAKIESVSAQINQGTKALINDIICNASNIYQNKIDKQTLVIIETNIKNSLGLFFRLHGLEYCEENSNPIFKSFENSISNNSDIISVARKGLTKPLGDSIIYSLGEVIRKPTEDQAKVLVEWSKAFIGAQIMSLDPSLKEFQITNFSKKTFLLDTDFLLYCVVKETKSNKIYKTLINELIKAGCKIIITEDVIYEAIKHAEFAERNYNYFRNTFNVVDEIIIEEKLANVFVKGYYNAKNEKLINPNTTFKKYLSNYYEPSNAYDFICEVIKLNLNKSVIFRKIEEIDTTKIPAGLTEKLSNAIFEATVKTAKAQYRTKDENKSISDTDSKQYLSAYYLNKINKDEINSILPGDFYLVTSSVRTSRCAYKIGLKENITVNPTTLLNILEQIGLFTVDAKEILNLLDNPFLFEVVNSNWDDVKKLVNAGVDLQDKNIVRLKADLNEVIHDHLSNKDAEDIDEEIDYEAETIKTKTEMDDYLNFAKVVKEKGYHFTPEIESLMLKFKELEDNNKVKDELIVALQEKAGLRLKRTKHYLSKLNNKKK